LIEGDDNLLLLDGQQRLATATVLLAVMRDIARSLDKGSAKSGADFARDIQRDLIEKDTDPPCYALTLSELDEPFFLKAIKEDPPSVPQNKLRSHVLLASAYKMLSEKLSALINVQAPQEALKSIKQLLDAMTKGMSLIAITVQSEDDAYLIFETLNDRGLRLSVPDLVLNLLMRRAPDATARGLVRQHWNAMLRELGKRDVSRFLRHLWVSRYGDIKAEGLFAAIKRELETNSLDSIAFAELCAEECDDYVALLECTVQLQTKQGRANLEGIVKYLQLRSAPPLLLAGYRCLSSGDFEKLLQWIVTTHIRFIVVTNQNPLDLESRLYEAARAIRTSAAAGDSSSKQLALAKAKIAELATTDAALQQAAEDVLLDRSEAVWLMAQLANSLQSETKEVGMDKANLEHVFPQSPNLTQWPNAATLESLTWNIGNLTILGERLNRQAQNKSFADKAANTYAKSEIQMTKDLMESKQWDEKTIRSRAKSLVAALAKLWPPIA
jgi:hypothetical protein